MVIIDHGFSMTRSIGHGFAVHIWGHDITTLIHASGIAGVWLFFVHSGYLMGKGFYCNRYALNVPGVFAYLRSRALRILPLYYFSLIACLPLSGHRLMPWQDGVTMWDFILFRIPLNNYNGPLWSISTEVQFYAIVPLLFLLFAELRNWRVIIGIILGLFVINGYLRYCILNQQPAYRERQKQIIFITIPSTHNYSGICHYFSPAFC